MPRARIEVPQLENMVGAGKKKFVRYAEGASLYSLGLHTFQEIAKEANAVYKVKRCVLVNTEKVDEYLENCCETNLKVIQDIMGHADISTTMDIYAEATEEMKKKVLTNLEGKIII